MSSPHRERGVRRVDDDSLLAHPLDATAGEAESPPRRAEYDVGRAFVGLEDVAINDDASVLVEGKLALIAEGHLQACARPVRS